MGLFSDKCEVLIDPKTGRALTGDELEKAKKIPSWPRCGSSVRKKSRYCSKCGHGAPGGWWKCPSCDNWVGNESNFCWNCKQPLYPDERDAMAGGVWQKRADIFAQRINITDAKKLAQDGVMIQAGTAAILLDGGKYAHLLGPGRHNVDSLGHTINWFGNPPPRTVVLVDNGDVVIPVRVDSLRSSEQISLELDAEVTLHFVEKKADDFLANLFKDREYLNYRDLIAPTLAGELRYAAQNVCNTATIEDLVKDPERRLHVEDAFQNTLKVALERFGLEIVRVGAVDFLSREYEEMRKNEGEAEVARKQIEFEQHMRELRKADKMHEFKTQQELEDYARQLAQEHGVSQEKVNQEIAILRLIGRQEIEKKTADFAMSKETAEVAHKVGITRIEQQWKNEAALADADAEVKITKMWIEVKHEKLQVELEYQRELTKIRQGASIQTLISMSDDPVMRRDLLRLNEQALAQGRSPLEILAVGAANNPDLARVIADIERVKSGDREREIEERKKLLDAQADRMERLMKASLEMAAEAAKHQGSSQQIIK